MVVVAAVAVLVGVVVGAVVGHRLMGQGMERRSARLVDCWQRAQAAEEAELAVRRSHAVLRGQVAEQLAPLFDEFPYDPSDARFIGKPVDFIVFDGYTEVRAGRRPWLREIVFLDVKTGRAGLSAVERRIKQAVGEGRVYCQRLGTRAGGSR